MPQESLRSVYRSFVTCEDPRGLVEGKTIKISKSDFTKRGSRNSENQTQSKNLKEDSKKEKEKEMEKMSSCKTSSCYQLVEVKNGARKLTEAIDSWSKGGSFRGPSKDIAKDMLKGALDLQESLMMLGKLQEVSCMSKKSSEEDFRRIGSNQFESFPDYDLGYEKQRNLANGSYRDCYSELRDVIREGLSRHDLLPNKFYEESAFAGNEELPGKRMMQLSPDKPSTSSSRSSSMVFSTHEVTSSESFSSMTTEEKAKGTNLIAKLMGLEEFPSKPLPSSPCKHMEISSRTKPQFDVDLPNAKKPQSYIKKSDREHTTLDEIIKMMQSKGLLRSNKGERKEISRRLGDDAPPIVLMKPQRLGPENQKVKTSLNSIRKLHQEKAKPEVKAVKNRGSLYSDKQKGVVPVAKPQQKQVMEKKVDKAQKMAPQHKRKPADNLKSVNLAPKSASAKQVKPQRNALSNPISKQTLSSGSSTKKSSTQKKNSKIEKEVIEPLPTIIHEVLQISCSSEEETQDSEGRDREIENARHQSICKAFEGDSYCVTDDVTVIDHSNNYEESGVSDAGEQKDSILKSINSFQDSESLSSELLQDCVNELLEHEKRRKNSLLTISMLTSSVCKSEDHLTREIMKGITDLRNCSMIVKESSNTETVSGLLERDLCWSILGGTWSTGWKDGCTLDEIEEVVLDLENLVLSKLIDDILMELVT